MVSGTTNKGNIKNVSKRRSKYNHIVVTVSEDGSLIIPLTQGQDALLSPIDADLAKLPWSARKQTKGFYAVRAQNKPGQMGSVALHRVVFSRVLGRPLERREEVDHINNNKLDNRRENLRLATRAEQTRNSSLSRRSSSGYKGVSRQKSSGKWQAQIVVNGKYIHLGVFDDPKDAHAAYCKAATKYFGEFANFGGDRS